MQGVRRDTHLENNFKVSPNRWNVPAACIEFWCSGPGAVITGGSYQTPDSGKAIFEVGADGAFMRYGRGAERLELTNDPRGGVAAALEKVLDSYFKSVERIAALRTHER